VEDVEAVDLLDGGEGDRPCDGALLDALGEHLAPLGRQHLRIGQAVDAARRIQGHGGGVDRPGQWPAARLVDAAEQAI
jgi:hypothetical protein